MTRPTRTLQTRRDESLDLEAITAVLASRFTVVRGASRSVRTAQLDTFDQRLRAARMTLRCESGPDGDLLVLGHGDTTIAEHVDGLRWPALAGSLPAGLRDIAAPVTGIRALIVISEESRRLTRWNLLNADDKTVARVDVDEPESATSEGTLLTVQTLRGYEDQAQRALRLLEHAGLRPRGRRRQAVQVDAPNAAGADRHAPAPVLLATGLQDALATMRRNLPGLLDDVDTEFLHEFRVAVRRTRSTLKLGRSVLPEAVTNRWEPEFKGLGDLTTPVRDLDVYELDLPTMAGWLVAAEPADLDPFDAYLRSRRAAARLLLVRELRSTRFEHLLTQWSEELDRLVRTSYLQDGDVLSAGLWAERSISRASRRVMRAGRAVTPDSPATDLHALRKRCKELRYAIEVSSSVLATAPRMHALAHLKGLQDVLGQFQDCEVQSTALRGFAEAMMSDGTPASTLLAMGELIAHLDAEQARARRQFDGAFADFSRRSTQQIMENLGGATR